MLADAGRPGLALYVAGVAAEAALRSRIPPGTVFDGRHDLVRLALTAGYIGGTARTIPRRTERLNTFNRLWRNSFRYMSDDKIARILHAARQFPESADRGRTLVRLAASAAIAEAGHIVQASLSPPKVQT